MPQQDYPILFFETSDAWRLWLDTNHATTDGVWLQLFKKASGVASITYAGALDEALCYGWIDGQTKSYDDKSYLQKFTPRRARSMWSKRNIEYIARLEAAGQMTQAGRAEVERAQADGRWQAAYDKPTDMVIPEDFLNALEQNKSARDFYNTLGKSSTYLIGLKLQTAKKPETRLRRMNLIISQLENKIKPS